MKYSRLWESYNLAYLACLASGIDVAWGGDLAEWAQMYGLELAV